VGSFRKWLAAFLTVCMAVTSVGINVRAQNIPEDMAEASQEFSAVAEEYAEESEKGQEEDNRKQAESEKGQEEDSRKQAEAGTLNFLMMDSASVQTPGVQNIAVSLGQESMILEGAELTYRRVSDGSEFAVEAAEFAGNMVKFAISYTDKSQAGVYELTGVRYQAQGKSYEVFFDDLGMEVNFGVNQENDTEPDEMLLDEEILQELEANVVTMDENGNTVSEQSMEDVLQGAQSANARTRAGRAFVNEIEKMVIVLDPGHDSTHAGARGNGCKEEELVLKIAQYCKTELQKYSGVSVFMTRSSNTCPNGGYKVDSGTCNARRVEFAVSKKADVYVSFHLNSNASTAPMGVGVYYPNNNYRPQIGQEGKGLAASIYKKLSALGLSTWAGGILIRNSETNTLYPDGSLADYLGVIRRSKEAGIPAVLIEHAFLSNASDVSQFLNSNAKLKKLGIADAQGIASFYGLSVKGTVPMIDWIQSRNSKTLRVNWEGAANAVSYEVYRSTSAKGKYTKLAEVNQCRYDDKTANTGTTYYYKVRAVFSDGTKSSYSKVYSAAALAKPEITSVVSKAVGKLKLTWGPVNGASLFEIWRCDQRDGKYQKIGATKDTSFIDKDIETQKEYFYKVRARGGDKNGCGGCSDISSGWAVMKTSIRNVSSADSTSLRIRWKKVDNAYAYRIQRSTSKKGKYKTIANVKGNKTSYVDKGVKAKKKYYYKVQVLNRVDGKNGYSGYCSAVAGSTITGTSLIYVKSMSSSGMELKWKKHDDAYAYSIKRSTKKNGVFEKIAEIRDRNITQYQDKNIVSGKRYHYVVEVIVSKKKVKGYSGNSKSKSAVNLRKVNIVSIKSTNKGNVLAWDKVAGANCYEIMRSTKESGGFTEIAKVQGADVTSFTDQTAAKGQKYYYRIRAVREGKYPGYGSYGKVAESGGSKARRK